jgi:hypothetical protein
MSAKTKLRWVVSWGLTELRVSSHNVQALTLRSDNGKLITYDSCFCLFRLTSQALFVILH